MSKIGLKPSEWRKRLQEYAEGTFTFGSGQEPPKGSIWATEVAKIEPRCGPQELLRSKGLYHRVRLVLDVNDSYYLAAEYMRCAGTFNARDHRMLEQLTDGVRARFPVVLARKYACDQAVIYRRYFN